MKEVGLDGLSFELQRSSSDIASPVINVHTLRKKGEIKTESFLTRFYNSSFEAA